MDILRNTLLSEKKFPCGSCGQRFDTSRQVMLHLKSKSCQVKNQTQMNAPLSVDLMKCEDCGKSFLTKRQILYHKKTNKCKVSTKKVDKVPVKKSTADSPAKMVKHYQCQTCGKVFPSNGNYIRHYLGQHGNRKFVCDECGFRFNYSDSLRRHKQLKPSQTRKKVYPCRLCEDKFTNSRCLSSHLEMWHKVDSPRKKKLTTDGTGSSPQSLRGLNGLSSPKTSFENKSAKNPQGTSTTQVTVTKDVRLFNSMPKKLVSPGDRNTSVTTSSQKPASTQLLSKKLASAVQLSPQKTSQPVKKIPLSFLKKSVQSTHFSSTEPGHSMSLNPVVQPGAKKLARMKKTPSLRGKSTENSLIKLSPVKVKPMTSPTYPYNALVKNNKANRAYKSFNGMTVQSGVPLKLDRPVNKAYKSFSSTMPPGSRMWEIQTEMIRQMSSSKITNSTTTNSSASSSNGEDTDEENVDGDRKPHICIECGEAFTILKKLTEHQRVKHNHTPDAWPELNKKPGPASKTIGKLKKRRPGPASKTLTKQEKPDPFIESETLESLPSKSSEFVPTTSTEQINWSLYDEKPFICGVCNRVFIIEASLIIHRQEAHGGQSSMPTPNEIESSENIDESEDKKIQLQDDDSLRRKSKTVSYIEPQTDETLNIDPEKIDPELLPFLFDDDNYHGHSLRKKRKLVSYEEPADFVIDSDNEIKESRKKVSASKRFPKKSAAVKKPAENQPSVSSQLGQCYVVMEKLSDDQIKTKYSSNSSRKTVPKKKSSNKNLSPFQILQKYDIEVEDYENMTCGICGVQSNSVQDKIAHLRSHKRSVQCKLCKAIFTRRCSLKIHFVSQHIGKGLFFCEICKQSFHNQATLKTHTKSHSETVVTKEKRFRHDCSQCEAVFRRKSSLDKHIKQHASFTWYKCTCGKQFETKYGRRVHRKNCFGAQPKYFGNCYVVLDKLTDEEINLYTYLPQKKDNNIEDSENVTGADMGAEIDDPAKLTCTEILEKYGIQPEEEDTGLSCNVCGMLFDSLLAKQTHMRSHKYRNRCKVCRKLYSSPTSLKRHYIGQHLGTKLFKCKHCDKAFNYRDMLNIHLRSHTEESTKMFCRFCPLTFMNYWTRDKHEFKEHTGIKPYCCKYCNLRFLVRNTYYCHQRQCAKIST